MHHLNNFNNSFNIKCAFEFKANYSALLSYRYADQVSVGDEIMVVTNDKLMPTRVTNVSSLIMKGSCISSNLFVFIILLNI